MSIWLPNYVLDMVAEPACKQILIDIGLLNIHSLDEFFVTLEALSTLVFKKSKTKFPYFICILNHEEVSCPPIFTT